MTISLTRVGLAPPAEGGVAVEPRFVVDPILARVLEFRDEADNLAAFKHQPIGRQKQPRPNQHRGDNALDHRVEANGAGKNKIFEGFLLLWHQQVPL
jgi:hypothetical protein